MNFDGLAPPLEVTRLRLRVVQDKCRLNSGIAVKLGADLACQVRLPPGMAVREFSKGQSSVWVRLSLIATSQFFKNTRGVKAILGAQPFAFQQGLGSGPWRMEDPNSLNLVPHHPLEPCALDRSPFAAGKYEACE